KIGQLEFRAPDEVRFPALRLAREVMAAGGLSGAVFNAAKEAALAASIAGEIGLMDMAHVVDNVLERGHASAILTLENVRAADQIARRQAREIISAGI
ncbi:MAG: 1-deoxy-D-xylulose-5-phosphate reductoisomerase, partial [Rhodobacteraceae bacterium]|nr:1-deoxy-D-xylulose-5-phosphate reductoisomerase [Paracoccaceae bacterium]